MTDGYVVCYRCETPFRSEQGRETHDCPNPPRTPAARGVER